jgi:hypothetical protein
MAIAVAFRLTNHLLMMQETDIVVSPLVKTPQTIPTSRNCQRVMQREKAKSARHAKEQIKTTRYSQISG